ncbi:hypothetical protein GGX14DRAFT_581064 [Mycena pura]|uniref:Uncharacterized protein n=1 Tax=Mycena pura TaxID=153505 RepID=A0AAD6Y0L3_9AGAR|nr:hypothetical protein GGX14DRAFT_581064 [Mycena pura]
MPKTWRPTSPAARALPTALHMPALPKTHLHITHDPSPTTRAHRLMLAACTHLAQDLPPLGALIVTSRNASSTDVADDADFSDDGDVADDDDAAPDADEFVQEDGGEEDEDVDFGTESREVSRELDDDAPVRLPLHVLINNNVPVGTRMTGERQPITFTEDTFEDIYLMFFTSSSIMSVAKAVKEVFPDVSMSTPAVDQEKEPRFTCRVWFREVIRILHQAGILTCTDVDALEEECAEHAKANQAALPTWGGYMHFVSQIFILIILVVAVLEILEDFPVSPRLHLQITKTPNPNPLAPSVELRSSLIVA